MICRTSRGYRQSRGGGSYRHIGYSETEPEGCTALTNIPEAIELALTARDDDGAAESGSPRGTTGSAHSAGSGASLPVSFSTVLSNLLSSATMASMNCSVSIRSCTRFVSTMTLCLRPFFVPLLQEAHRPCCPAALATVTRPMATAATGRWASTGGSFVEQRLMGFVTTDERHWRRKRFRACHHRVNPDVPRLLSSVALWAYALQPPTQMTFLVREPAVSSLSYVVGESAGRRAVARR